MNKSKRFVYYVTDEDVRIIDLDEKVFYDDFDLDKICKLLNELYEEKEMWKTKCQREKVELEDIIELVKTDELTNSVELKKELYK